jgi:hypothetical protein
MSGVFNPLSGGRPGFWLLFLLGLSLLLSPETRATTQQPEETELYRQFGFSRTKKPGAKSEPDKTTKSAVNNPPEKKKQSPDSGNNQANTKPRPAEKIYPPAVTSGSLALGYTILQAMRAAEGERILTTGNGNVFKIGDRVRLLIEANADGYLYVFNTLAGQEPELVFPNAKLNNGGNFLNAHVACEIPSRENPNPKLQWFEFQPPPGVEQLYLVFSREPLEKIPIGRELIARCRGQSDCIIQPEADVWSGIIAAEKGPKQEQRIKDGPQPLTQEVNKTVARRLRLPPEAPKPTVLHQNQSAGDRRIVVVVNLETRR